MSSENSILPHHEQLPLCTTRLPYRQGRKLTAVKVYTVNSESNHLLVFGVPALSLRHEAQSLFLRYGELKQFHESCDHPGDDFTETYHVNYHTIQPARLAKRMLDTKSFYGGTLHVSYAPELENTQETKQKLTQRRLDVSRRLNNLNKERNQELHEASDTQEVSDTQEASDLQEASLQEEHTNNTLSEAYNAIENEVHAIEETKLDMGAENVIYLKNKFNTSSVQRLHKSKKKVIIGQATVGRDYLKSIKKRKKNTEEPCNEIEVVDFTDTNKAVLSNINEGLNYRRFGNEDIRSVEVKPLSRIQFNKST